MEWFERDISGGEERRIFRARTSEGNAVGNTGQEQHTFNSTELRLICNPGGTPGSIQLQMQPIAPMGGTELGIIQHLARRASGRLAQVTRPNYRNITYAVHQIRAEAPEQLWEISAASERVILDNCW